MIPRFGTDGWRGRAYDELTVDFVRLLGDVAASVLGGDTFFIGRDTRESGPDLEQAFADGLARQGVQAKSLHVTSTPAVAWLSAADGIAAAMISASHNPYTDNGIKLFAPGGAKLSDLTQLRIQDELDRRETTPASTGAAAIIDCTEELVRYRRAVVDSLEGRDLRGLRLVVDCANGSNSEIAPAVLTAVGAEVEVIHDRPDGRNINDHCGSTYPDDLQRLVVERGADIGLAFDGDADRVLAVDHRGGLIDGDQIIAICAIDRHERGLLVRNTVAVTVMSNLGFRLSMQDRGIEVIETPVGDRHVLEALEREGATLGGEQSGHIIFSELATTGDGLLTAVQLLDVVCRSARSLAELAALSMTRLPQVLCNVRVPSSVARLDVRLRPAVARVEAALAGRGRVLIRPSGTEPLVRVMVEAPTEREAATFAQELAEAVTALAAE
ncbi:MAG TPA: phosphoglucosamine mutase [Acidimicrobiales bacterium]|nr:phosphoglucosamine mutase [Acidimicrobiales bacterium]